MMPGTRDKFSQDAFAKELLDLWDEREMQGSIFILADSDGPAAFVLLELKKGVAPVIRGTFTLEDRRGRGYATQLINKVLTEMCTEKGVFVNITSGAEELYLGLGFRILGVRKDFPDQKVACWGNVSKSETDFWKSKCQQEIWDMKIRDLIGDELPIGEDYILQVVPNVTAGSLTCRYKFLYPKGQWESCGTHPISEGPGGGYFLELWHKISKG